MLLETEGLVLRRRNIVNERKMLILLTEKYGKLSVGTNINLKSKSKTALPLSPFTISRFEIYKKGEFYNISKAETKESYFSIGEDIDKYIAGSSILELTDKVIDEGENQRDVYKLLVEFLQEISFRKSDFKTLTIAYKIKLLKLLGYMPNLANCGTCGRKDNLEKLSVSEGTVICKECYNKNNEEDSSSSLIFNTSFDILNIIIFFENKPLSAFRELRLDEKKEKTIDKILGDYYKCHLGIDNMKSDEIALN